MHEAKRRQLFPATNVASKACPVTTARKMFPKRKLEESRSGSESQKEEEEQQGAEEEEEEARRTKRARVESSPDAGGQALRRRWQAC